MSEQEKPQERQEERAPISDRKRTALLRYMAVLFGVAFLLVLLSLMIQMRDSRQTISDLSQSQAGVLQRAEQLQDENQQLGEDNNDLRSQLTSVRQSLKDAQSALDEETAAREEAETALEEARTDAEARSAQEETLHEAAGAWIRGDADACAAALTRVDRDALGQAGKTLFDQLKAALSAETAEEQE